MERPDDMHGVSAKTSRTFAVSTVIESTGVLFSSHTFICRHMCFMLMKAACMDVTFNRLLSTPPPPLTGSILGLLIGQWLGLFFPPEWVGTVCGKSLFQSSNRGPDRAHKNPNFNPLTGKPSPTHTMCL